MAEEGEMVGAARFRRESSVSDDYAVQLTNDNATECKVSAVALGYWNDRFIPAFWHGKPERKDPEISRGYWARIKTIRMLLDKCLKKVGASCQIINLGAGFDTLYWQLVEGNVQFSNFTDVDFGSNTAKKIHHIMKPNSCLKNFIAKDVNNIVTNEHVDLHGDRYHLVGADLRQSKEFINKLEAAKLDFNKPTVFICECVLIYMAADKSATLLSLLSQNFPNSCLINYEQVNLGDTFGAVMKEHLHNRGLSLAGLDACMDLNSQKQRFLESGWSFALAWSMTKIYKELLPKDERERIEKLEMLDEAELLFQLLDHYCVVFAANTDMFKSITL